MLVNITIIVKWSFTDNTTISKCSRGVRWPPGRACRQARIQAADRGAGLQRGHRDAPAGREGRGCREGRAWAERRRGVGGEAAAP